MQQVNYKTSAVAVVLPAAVFGKLHACVNDTPLLVGYWLSSALIKTRKHGGRWSETKINHNTNMLCADTRLCCVVYGNFRSKISTCDRV